MHKDLEKILYTKQEIDARVKEIAAEITADYAGKEVLMICILRGAVLFYADVVRELDLVDVRMDFMAVTSYGAGTQSTGDVRIIKDLSQPIEGLHVIIVEDIMDTGNTLKRLCELLWTRRPASIKICSFLDKPSRRKVDLTPDYNGFVVPDEFIVGYGLDYAERYRNLKEVAVLKPSVYADS